MSLARHSVLLVVDMQVDFCPGGALAVPDGDKMVSRINAYIALFAAAGRPVVASRDWHPPHTTHFALHGGQWPVHCVQGTPGAAFHPDLQLPRGAIVVSKGMGAEEDAYSAFQARDEKGILLPDLLRMMGAEHVYVGGLALDYCVRFSALDALREGFAATALVDASRAVNVKPHDGEEAIEELVRARVLLATIELLKA